MAKLTDINGIGEATAVKLAENGIESVEELAALNSIDLEEFGVKEEWWISARSLYTEVADPLIEIESDHDSDENDKDDGPETDADDQMEFTFTFDLGYFEGKDFWWKEGLPAFKYGLASLGQISLVTLEDVRDDSVEGQKFKLFYSGEWSSAVMPKQDYKDFKSALNEFKSTASIASPMINNGTQVNSVQSTSVQSYAPTKSSGGKKGCTACGR